MYDRRTKSGNTCTLRAEREEKNMNEAVVLHREAMDMLKQTSRTFFIPINFLEPTLRKTVASAYLCMRAIDEIEDHRTDADGPDVPLGKTPHQRRVYGTEQGHRDVTDDVGDGEAEDLLVHVAICYMAIWLCGYVVMWLCGDRIMLG